MVELMVTATVLALMVLIVSPLLLQMVRFFRINSAKVEIQRDARTCLDLINRFLRQANSATVTISNATGQPPHSRIAFTTVSGTNFIYYQQNNKLFQVTTTTSTLSSNLRYLSFSYPRSDDPTIISVALTMEKATIEGRTKALELTIEKVRVMN